jgi:hypothetical protein
MIHCVEAEKWRREPRLLLLLLLLLGASAGCQEPRYLLNQHHYLQKQIYRENGSNTGHISKYTCDPHSSLNVPIRYNYNNTEYKMFLDTSLSSVTSEHRYKKK